MSSAGKGGLVPGFKHVEQFGPDEDYEDDDNGAEEEFYVTLDLGSVDHTLVPSSSSYRLIGLDTETPFLQLSGTIMRGYHESLIGTELVFKDLTEVEEEEGADTPAPNTINTNTNTNKNNTNVRYLTKTNRRIVFREVELKKPKPKTDSGSGATSTSTGTGSAESHKETKKRHANISSLYFGIPVGGPAEETSSAAAACGTDPAVQCAEAGAPVNTTTARTELNTTVSQSASPVHPSENRHMDVDE